MDYLAEAKHFHAQVIEPLRGKPIGCCPEEIEALEGQVGFPLPEAYRQYLLWMGRDERGIFGGCDWFITDVLNNARHLPRLLADNGVRYTLPAHYLAFFGHQGYMMAWFVLPKMSEDPPAYFFSEAGYEEPDEPMAYPEVVGTFTDVLLRDMKGLASSGARIVTGAASEAA